jgi:L-lactate dehydrogenase
MTTNDNTRDWIARKIVIVGAGSVGATFAYAMMLHGAADEIVIIDIDEELAEGQADDLSHGRAFMPPVQIRHGDKSDYADAHIIVMTAGASQKSGETRLDLVGKNMKIVKSIMDDIQSVDSGALLLMVTNPVDILTNYALEISGWDRSRVLGSGTVLDTARFRHMLSRHCGVDVKNVHAYILGEHGDSEMAAWSMAHMAGLPMDNYCRICGQCSDWKKEREEMVDHVRNSAYHIIDYKGATNFGIGMALTRIVGTILHNERSVLTVSTRLEGEYDIEGIALSVPCLVTSEGIDRVLIGDLTDEEMKQLHHSADVLKKTYNDAQKP